RRTSASGHSRPVYSGSVYGVSLISLATRSVTSLPSPSMTTKLKPSGWAILPKRMGNTLHPTPGPLTHDVLQGVDGEGRAVGEVLFGARQGVGERVVVAVGGQAVAGTHARQAQILTPGVGAHALHVAPLNGEGVHRLHFQGCPEVPLTR